MHADRPLDPAALTDTARAALTDALYAVQAQIFDGVDRETFRRYVVDSPAERTRIQVFRSALGGDVIGYAAAHVFTVDVDGAPTAVLRSEVGLLPAWRGRSAACGLLLREIARLLVTRPLQQRCFVACPVHPASYYAVSRASSQVWPRPGAETPAPIQRLLGALDGALGLSRPDGAGEHVRAVGWITRQSSADADRWTQHASPLVRYFIAQNPGYHRGDGLRIVTMLTAGTVADGLRLLLRRRAQRLGRALGALAARRPRITAQAT